MTMQHPRLWLLPLPQRIICVLLFGLLTAYPDSTYKNRLTSTVKVTLKTTLTSNQNIHSLPIS
jgi:hypothetical protein